jgi:hypothetical protein
MEDDLQGNFNSRSVIDEEWLPGILSNIRKETMREKTECFDIQAGHMNKRGIEASCGKSSDNFT